MPYGDRTGPDGAGSMTGRRMGFCAGNDSPGCQTGGRGSGYGRGFGRGRGMGRGRGFGRRPFWSYDYVGPRVVPVYRDPAPEDEKTYLDGYMKSLEAELKSVKERLKELAAKK